MKNIRWNVTKTLTPKSCHWELLDKPSSGLFLLVLGMGCVILLCHTRNPPYNYSAWVVKNCFFYIGDVGSPAFGPPNDWHISVIILTDRKTQIHYPKRQNTEHRQIICVFIVLFYRLLLLYGYPGLYLEECVFWWWYSHSAYQRVRRTSYRPQWKTAIDGRRKNEMYHIICSSYRLDKVLFISFYKTYHP